MKNWLFAEGRTGIPRLVQGVMVVLAVAISTGLVEAWDWFLDLRAAAGRCP